MFFYLLNHPYIDYSLHKSAPSQLAIPPNTIKSLFDPAMRGLTLIREMTCKPKKTEYNKTIRRKRNAYSAEFKSKGLLGDQYTLNELEATKWHRPR